MINKNVIYSIYGRDALKLNNLVNYYGGKGKLIIENKNNKEDSILLINPLKEEQNENNIFFISTNRQNSKYRLYKNIIMNNLQIGILNDFNSIIYSFNEYFQNNNKKKSTFEHINIIMHKDDMESFKQDILKIFIYIFYFELSLLEANKKEDIFNKDNTYFLINPKWMIKFKNYYNYHQLYNLIIEINRNNALNYCNLDKKIDSLIKSCLKKEKEIKIFEKAEIYKELLNYEINSSFRKIEDITFYDNCYFLPLEIITMLTKIGFIKNEELLEFKEIIAKDEDIFLLHEDGFEIGKLNN